MVGMSKVVTKSAAIKEVSDSDALEIRLEIISRDETSASKQIKVNRFINDIQKQIKDQRDVKLLMVTIK